MDDMTVIRLAVEAGSVEVKRHAVERMIERSRPLALITGSIRAGACSILSVRDDEDGGTVTIVRCRATRGPVDCVFGVDGEEVRLITIYVPSR